MSSPNKSSRQPAKAVEGLDAILAHNVIGERNDCGGPILDEDDDPALGLRSGCTFDS